MTFLLGNLRNRIRYGIKEELLELAQLKGVGRIRARRLHDKGLTHFALLKRATFEELSRVDKIGKTLAKDILKQIN